MTLSVILLVAVALAFAFSMGAHYTGACMGMPYASGSIGLRPALILMVGLTFIGAALLSHGVLATVGHHILVAPRIEPATAIAIVGSAFLLTTLFNLLKIPSSTIQILVFCLAGVGLAQGQAIRWHTIGGLALLWLLAPPIATALGFSLTRLLDRRPFSTLTARTGAVARLLVATGALASLAMGANDVANATAVFLSTHRFTPLAAGALGGLGLAAGVLLWGRPLLQRVAFDVVRLDLRMASAAQAAQALVVLAAVAGGGFTSMNQALIGAMAGAGLARGRDTIRWRVIRDILLGWLIGPAAGLALGGVAGYLAQLQA